MKPGEIGIVMFFKEGADYGFVKTTGGEEIYFSKAGGRYVKADNHGLTLHGSRRSFPKKGNRLMIWRGTDSNGRVIAREWTFLQEWKEGKKNLAAPHSTPHQRSTHALSR